MWEHGGWYQTYYFGENDGEGHCLYTANDAAHLDEKAKSILSLLRQAKTEAVWSVRRGCPAQPTKPGRRVEAT